MAQPSKRRHRKRGAAAAAAAEDPDLERLNSLPWNPSFSGDDEPFSLPIGSNDLEGGFLSLEEIDESEYGLGIPKPGREDESDKPKAEPKKKRKRDHGDGNSDGAVDNDNGTKVEEKENAETGKKKRQKRKKKKKKVKKSSDHAESMENIAQPVTKDVEQVTNIVESVSVNTMAVDSSKDKFEGESADEAEFHAWGELRLHPLLMRSIYKLGFKEPTPIQRACIPAAAHQGKDVVGAAETGSGKTLAFGLPILQRLIEEWEKSENEFLDSEKVAEKYASGGFLRALIVTPTRELALQVTDHLKAVAVGINVRVVPIVGGMSTEKQERLLRARPEIVVGTPGRLWELMSGGESHLTELHSLSFFVLDEADRMVENGHFHELQSIIDMLPMRSGAIKGNSSNTENCVTVTSFQRKKRQTFVFSATIALSADFRKKLKRGSLQSKQSMSNELNSIETLSERAGMRENAAIVDLTNASIMANKLEESFIECREEEKDAYLYYILSVHGQGRTLVFCTSIAALRHTSSLLRILNINVWTLHAQMQQRARLKAIDRFRGNEHGILVATDVAARGLDIPNVRTIVHYQLPHSAEVYVHRSGRTARAASDGCSIALISPNDRSKFASLCKSFSKESFQQFPLDSSYIPEVLRRLSLARQIDKILRKDSQDKAEKNWFERNAESVELVVEEDNGEEEKVNSYKKKKASSVHLKKLQQELCVLLSRPLQPRTFSRRFLAGAGVSPVLQQQFEELARQKLGDKISGESKRRKLLVIGQDCVEPLQALRSAGHEVHVDLKAIAEKRRNMENTRRKRRDEKKRLREQRRKQRKKQKGHSE